MPTDLAAERSEEVLRTLGMWRVPVDPLAIAKEEGIELAPGRYGRQFDARIEYLPAIRRFVIYYQEPEVAGSNPAGPVATILGAKNTCTQRSCLLRANHYSGLLLPAREE